MHTIEDLLRRQDSLQGQMDVLRKEILASKNEKTVTGKITDRIKSYNDVCDLLGIDPIESLPFKNPSTNQHVFVNASFKLDNIVSVINQGWQPDWTNTKEYKWYNWFEYNSKTSGFGFSGTYWGYSYTGTYVGSRLVFKTEELATYAGKQFLTEYNEFLNPTILH